jgi:hypothetical protein
MPRGGSWRSRPTTCSAPTTLPASRWASAPASRRRTRTRAPRCSLCARSRRARAPPGHRAVARRGARRARQGARLLRHVDGHGHRQRCSARNLGTSRGPDEPAPADGRMGLRRRGPTPQPIATAAFAGGCRKNPRRARWIRSMGGLRRRPSPPSRDGGRLRSRRAQPLWHPLSGACSGISDTTFSDSLVEKRQRGTARNGAADYEANAAQNAVKFARPRDPRRHDGQLAVFYGPELAARVRAAGSRRRRSRRKL